MRWGEQIDILLPAASRLREHAIPPYIEIGFTPIILHIQSVKFN
jgi:hypothetical protein